MLTSTRPEEAESGLRRSFTLNSACARWLGEDGLEGNFNGGSLIGGEDARLTGTLSECECEVAAREDDEGGGFMLKWTVVGASGLKADADADAEEAEGGGPGLLLREGLG